MARKAAIILILVMVTVGVVGLALLQRVRAAGQTWIVTSAMDSGPGTLRSCLANAATGDTITFDSSVFPPASPVTINLTSELPHIIQGNLTIDASGAGVILNGSQTPADTVGLFVDSEDNTIKGLQVLHFPGCGIRLTANANHNIIGGDRTIGAAPYGEGNVISCSRAHVGIALDNSSNNTISGNTITGNNGTGIYLDESSNNSIIGNNITNNEYGITLYASSNNSLAGNTASNNDHGIKLDSSSGNAISGNNITANNIGINLDSSLNNTISRNNVVANKYEGIYLEWYSNYNSIHGNNVTANYDDGIDLDDSSNNTIYGNIITNNYEFGIELYSSFDNTIYSNNFVDNTQQVYINASGSNTWDDGYPSGGNYWSDYTDVDQYSGPDQNEPGSDEIWDHPYIIDENNQDNYPIVPEFPSFLILPLFMMATLLAVVLLKKRKHFTVEEEKIE